MDKQPGLELQLALHLSPTWQDNLDSSVGWWVLSSGINYNNNERTPALSPPWVWGERILPPRPGLTGLNIGLTGWISIFCSPLALIELWYVLQPHRQYTTTTTSNVINLINLAVDVINTNTNANILSGKYYLLSLLSFIFSQPGCPGPIDRDSHIDFRGF